MVEMSSVEEDIVQGSNNFCTTNLSLTDKPLVVRGVVDRKKIRSCRQQNRDFYYTDTGYFGNFTNKGNPGGKKLFLRIVKNDLQKHWIEHWPSDRWKDLLKIDSRLNWPGWKTKGNKILLVLPNPKACVGYEIDFETWKSNTLKTIKNHTDMPVIVREKGSRGHRQHYSIYDALDEGVFATVAFNSIAAMESIAYGVPAFVSVPCAASPLALTDLTKIETPYYPDEMLVKKHCCSLAYGQFTHTEILNGTAWKILNRDNNEIIG
jgi:hypothetical protein